MILHNICEAPKEINQHHTGYEIPEKPSERLILSPVNRKKPISREKPYRKIIENPTLNGRISNQENQGAQTQKDLNVMIKEPLRSRNDNTQNRQSQQEQVRMRARRQVRTHKRGDFIIFLKMNNNTDRLPLY